MLRNWGGGVWQRDEFYALCDRLGLLVWNEATFACNDYPVGKHFLASVVGCGQDPPFCRARTPNPLRLAPAPTPAQAKEVHDNVLRLQHHPSIVLWSGNNENEYRYRPGTPAAALYGELYFATVLPSITAIDDDSRPFMGSSPSCGNETRAEPVCANPQTQARHVALAVAPDPWSSPAPRRRADIHFYDYKSDCWDVSTFPTPRFASEYGYQSWAWHDTVVPVRPPRRPCPRPLLTRRCAVPAPRPALLRQRGDDAAEPPS